MTATRILSFLCFTLIAVFTQAKDIAGGKDHPLVSRFVGSQLDGFQEIAFGEGSFFLPDPAESAKELLRDKPVMVEGKVTRLLYITQKGKSPLEVHRNFEVALKEAGATLTTSVNGKGAWWEPAQHWRLNFSKQKFQGGWADDVSPFWRDGLYLYGVIKRGESLWHISVLTAQNFAENNDQQAAIAIQIVEPVAMKTGQVSINADALKQGLGSDGKIALYEIYFDTGKANLKPESNPQLEQMAILLRKTPALKVFIVGHTDNQGSFDANINLSQRRAEAVISSLVKDHNIEQGRLIPKGIANISPVASNNTEKGRTRNRRVELVEQ